MELDAVDTRPDILIVRLFILNLIRITLKVVWLVTISEQYSSNMMLMYNLWSSTSHPNNLKSNKNTETTTGSVVLR
jgi:hypothetical protein